MRNKKKEEKIEVKSSKKRKGRKGEGKRELRKKVENNFTNHEQNMCERQTEN